MDGGPYSPQNAYQCARKIFPRALNGLLKHPDALLSPVGVSASFSFAVFFCWHGPCKGSRVRPGVLAHPPLLPTAGASDGLFRMNIEWMKLFGLSIPLGELVVRGSVMFVFLWLLLRWSTPTLAHLWWLEHAKEGKWDSALQRYLFP